MPDTTKDAEKGATANLNEDDPPSEEMKDLLKRRATAKMVFTKKVNLFQDRLEKGDPYDSLKLSYSQIEERFDVLESICLEIVDFYSAKGYDQEYIDEALEYSSRCESLKYDKHSQLLGINQTPKEPEGAKPVSKPKFEPLRFPKFDGTVRDYPGFIGDFNQLVLPVHGKNPSILKQCLTGQALETVRNRDTDFDIMMQLLKEEFGNHQKVVQAVVGDLRKLSRVADDDTGGFLKFIRIVHTCFVDLEKVDMQSEISNTSVVNDLQDLLPIEAYRRWIRICKNIKDKNELFPKLLEFLLEEKRELEILQSTASRKVESIKVNTVSEPEPKVYDLMFKMQEQQNNTASLLEKICSKLFELEAKPAQKDRVVEKNSNSWCYAHDFSGHNTTACGKFRGMTSQDRLDLLRRKRICFNCIFSTNHSAVNCPRSGGCTVSVAGVLCNQRHHALVHDALMSTAVVALGSNIFTNAAKVLLETSRVYSGGKPVHVLWDSGATGSLITHRKARELGAVGVPVSGPMSGVGDYRAFVHTKQYVVKLQDLWGNTHEIICAGMDEVAGKIAYFDIQKLTHLFPEFNVAEMVRPSGYVDMLIGNDYTELQPRPVAEVGKLQMMQSLFGFSIRGKPPDELCCNTLGAATINNVAMDLTRDPIKAGLDNLFYVESAGVQAPIQESSLAEDHEMELVERRLRYDEANKVWIAGYPWIQDPESLPDNFKAVLNRLLSLEKSLMKDEHFAKAYQKEMNDMVDRGVARLLDQSEIASHSGPIHYIAHFAVHKAESASTPLRIVFDPTTQFMGHRLNEFWAKGPNFVANLFVVLLRFRRDHIGMAGDISKMYHSVKLECREQHVHRFLWRNLKVNEKPQKYVLTTVTFGDRPSGILAITAMKYTALMHQEEYPDVVDVVLKDTYVDDLLPNADTRANAEALASRVDAVLAEGSFHVKGWVMTGDKPNVAVDVDVSKELGQKVLGMRWDPAQDVFKFIVKLNFSPKHRGVRPGKNIVKEELNVQFPSKLTRRMVVSQIAATFDPYGFLIPFTLKSKLLIRSLVTPRSEINQNKSIDWDEHLQPGMVEEWKGYFLLLFNVEGLVFPRSIKPQLAVGNPMLIVFSDASESAYGCCAYARWACSDGQYRVRLIAAKGRVAPLLQQTIPRLEAAGAVLGVRLRVTIEKDMGIQFEEVVHVVDSAIVWAQIQKESHLFKMFVAVRIAEIQEKSDPAEWWWTESRNNVADMVTKPHSPEDLGNGSVWQEGPAFLKEERSQWPLRRGAGVQQEAVPDIKVHTVSFEHNQSETNSIWQNIDTNRFHSFSKLVRVVAVVLSVVKNKSFQNSAKIDVVAMNAAEELLIRAAQTDLGNWEKQFCNLSPFKKNGIVYVGGRIQQWMKNNWNSEAYILLPSEHPISQMIILELHESNHEGVETTLCKLLAKYWIPRARKLIRNIKNKCVRCRYLEKKVAGQCMGPVADTRLTPTPPFYNCATDLFGPLAIKDSVKRRTQGKCFGVIFTCLSSRAIHLEVAESCSTDAFLGAFRRFASLRGFPASMHSDNATQLIAANKELIEISKAICTKAVGAFAARHRMDWTFNRSSDAPWLNASCESLIKSVKVSLQKAINDSVLTFAEIQTVMYEVATMVNSRPIGVKPGNDINLGTYLSPNDLILGRNDRLAPVGTFDATANPQQRVRFLESIANNFWKRWQRDYFPTLILQKKWHASTRNVRVGDIVLVQDSNAVRGDWRLGEVVKVTSGRDGKVRDVTVRYKLHVDGASYQGSPNRFLKRSVHRLVVLLPAEEQ